MPRRVDFGENVLCLGGPVWSSACTERGALVGRSLRHVYCELGFPHGCLGLPSACPPFTHRGTDISGANIIVISSVQGSSRRAGRKELGFARRGARTWCTCHEADGTFFAISRFLPFQPSCLSPNEMGRGFQSRNLHPTPETISSTLLQNSPDVPCCLRLDQGWGDQHVDRQLGMEL